MSLPVSDSVSVPVACQKWLFACTSGSYYFVPGKIHNLGSYNQFSKLFGAAEAPQEGVNRPLYCIEGSHLVPKI